MRKVSNKAANALCNGKTMSKLNNTCVEYRAGDNSLVMTLHGHDVACWYYSEQTLGVSLAGYPTVTTRERVNAVLEIAGSPCRIAQRKGEQILISINDPKRRRLAAIHPSRWYSLSYLAELEVAKYIPILGAA